jgi:hypothetical protein
MRWARETKDRDLALKLFSEDHSRFPHPLPWQSSFGVPDDLDPAEFDLGQMSADLTYREAQDLAWVVHVLQQSGVGAPDASR